ncbi:MAG: hypothetical protein AB2693_11690 [Candidatus Thiodiazotropha sp.]
MRFNNAICYVGMIHAGIGEKHLNAFLTTLAIPSISPKTLKRRERDIGPFIEKTAKESCERASYEEKLMTINESASYSGETPIPDCRSDHQQDQDGSDQISFEEAMAILESETEGMEGQKCHYLLSCAIERIFKFFK